MLPMELLHARLSGLALGLLFHLLGLPGGGVVGAMLGAGLYQLLAPEPAPLPKGLDLLVQVLAGILIGLDFRKDLLRPDLLPLAALSALVFLGTALALGLPVSRLSRLTGLPLKTLLFALAPGGITGMGPLSQAEGGNPALVGVFHTVRVFLLLLLVPLLARLLP
jgi:membrane AbrB-like protein